MLSPTTLPNATAGANYSAQLSAVGGVGAYTFGATGLPTNLILNSSNQISGQCTASSSNVHLTVHDSATPTANTASAGPLTITCNAAPAITTASPLADGIVNTAYSATVQMSGGTAPITWTLTPGTLPSGFALSQSGVLTGTPATAMTSTFSVKVTDFWGAIASKSFTVQFESVVTITSTSLPNGVFESPYQNGVTLGVSGGTGNGTYTFSATGLPPGLNIDPSAGTIGGTPTQAGTFHPTFTVTDQTPQTVMKQITLVVLAATGNPNWTNLAPATAPSARDSYAMAYDPVRAVTVMFGGTNLRETWTFGFPSQWTQQSPATSPSGWQGPAMAWNAGQDSMVLFGGAINGVPMNQTWVWDGSSWTKKSPANSPAARYYAGMAADPANNEVVLFGGSSTIGSSGALNDTWVWDGKNWVQKSPATVPTAVFAPSMSGGPTGPVLFGGLTAGSAATNQTWVWDGTNWNLQSPAVSPPARYGAGMAYDSQNGVVKLFGGSDGTNNLQDTWQWDGANWTQLNPANVPAARDTIAMAYDSGFQQVILFGGADSPQPDLGDTWALGGPAAPQTTLPGATAGIGYTANLGIIGGTPPYTIIQTGSPQSLPAGLNLNSTSGAITGATNAAGSYLVGISVVDSQGLSITPTFSLTVAPTGSLALSPTTLPSATMGTAYTVQLTPSGGVAPYTLSATGLTGSGLSLSGTTLGGTCTAQPGSVSIKVTDSALPTGNSTSFPYTLHCNAAPAILTTSPLTSGVVNAAYSATIQMSGGTAPIAWTLTPGTLPNGFSLSQAGVLTRCV